MCITFLFLDQPEDFLQQLQHAHAAGSRIGLKLSMKLYRHFDGFSKLPAVFAIGGGNPLRERFGGLISAMVFSVAR